MPTAYSRRFALVTGASQDFLVPPGKRAIVKCFTGFNPSASQLAAAILLQSVPVLSITMNAGVGTERTNLMIVAEAGETLRTLATNPCSAQASGYLLDA